jgi:hypothetical protein
MALEERNLCARKAEVANLQITVGVNKEVTWFEVSVEDACRVDILEAT